jgi:hypothetical protein
MKKIKLVINLLIVYGLSSSYAAQVGYVPSVPGADDRTACADDVPGCTKPPKGCSDADACLGNQKDCVDEINRIVSDNFRNLEGAYKKFLIKNDVFSRFLPSYYMLLQIGLQHTLTNGLLTDIDQNINADNMKLVNDLLSGKTKAPSMWFVLKALATTAFANFSHNPKPNSSNSDNPIQFDTTNKKVSFHEFPWKKGNDFLNIYARTAGVIGTSNSAFGETGKGVAEENYLPFTDCQIPFGDDNTYYTYPICPTNSPPVEASINCLGETNIKADTYGIYPYGIFDGKINLLYDSDFNKVYNTKNNLAPTDVGSQLVQIIYNYGDEYFDKKQDNRTDFKGCYDVDGYLIEGAEAEEKCIVAKDRKNDYVCPDVLLELQANPTALNSFSCKYYQIDNKKIIIADPDFLWTNDNGQPDPNGQNAPKGSNCYTPEDLSKKTPFKLNFKTESAKPACINVQYIPKKCGLLNNGNGPKIKPNADQRLNWPGNFYFLNDLYVPLKKDIQNLQSNEVNQTFIKEFENAVESLVNQRDEYDSSKVTIPEDDLENQITKKTLDESDLANFKNIIAKANKGDYFVNGSTSVSQAYQEFIKDITDKLPSFKKWLIGLLQQAATYNVMANDLNLKFIDYALDAFNKNEQANKTGDKYERTQTWGNIPILNMPTYFDNGKANSQPVISEVTQRLDSDKSSDSASNPMYRYYLNEGYELNNATIPVAYYQILKNGKEEIVNCPDLGQHRNVSWRYCNFANQKNQIACKRSYYDANDGLLTIFLPNSGMLNWLKLKEQKGKNESNSLACIINALSQKNFAANKKFDGTTNACNTQTQDAMAVIGLISTIGFAFMAITGPFDLYGKIKEGWQSIKEWKSERAEKAEAKKAEANTSDAAAQQLKEEELLQLRADLTDAQLNLDSLREISARAEIDVNVKIPEGHEARLREAELKVENLKARMPEGEFEVRALV